MWLCFCHFPDSVPGDGREDAGDVRLRLWPLLQTRCDWRAEVSHAHAGPVQANRRVARPGQRWPGRGQRQSDLKSISSNRAIILLECICSERIHAQNAYMGLFILLHILLQWCGPGTSRVPIEHRMFQMDPFLLASGELEYLKWKMF